MAAGGVYAQTPVGGNSLAPAATSGSTKKEVSDDKREELKSKLLKRKMELDGERIQTTIVKSNERQSIKPQTERRREPAAKPKEDSPKK